MNVAAMLAAANNPVARGRKPPPPITKEVYKRSRATLSARADARWKAIFGEDALTTGQLAAKRGCSHMGTLSSMYKLEKRGLVVRAGLAPTNGNKPTILWRWANTE
jgi:hypothetical protein